MEPPDSWDLLTASLAVCDLTKPLSAWSFMVVQGLVRDDDGDRDTFLELLRYEQARGDITGPSLARRVAGSLTSAGIALPAGGIPDPWAQCAGNRIELVASWAAGALSQEQLVHLRRWREHWSPASSRTAPSRERRERKPWWKLR